MNDTLMLIVAVLSGVATAIPLVIKLVQVVEKAIKERNWSKVLDLVMSLMEQAETLYTSGADKKTWVLSMVEQSASNLNYDIDMEAISKLIDSLCDMSRKVNPPTEKKV